jgi:hypothetical protein
MSSVPDHEHEYDPESSDETELIPQTSQFRASAFRAEDDEDVIDIAESVATIQARKPGKGEWFRAHPNWDKYSMPAYVIERDPKTGIDRDHIILPKYRHRARGKARPVLLLLCVNRFGHLFIWPVSRARSGLGLTWAQSAKGAAEKSKSRWTTMVSNQGEGRYEDAYSPDDLGEPDWPEEPFDVLLEIAYRGAVITTPDHPVLRSINGELIIRAPESQMVTGDDENREDAKAEAARTGDAS